MADGRWDTGSWGSAMCKGVYVRDRESDGSPLRQAAEAPGTDRGGSRDSVQSSTQMASSKELLQRMEEIHEDLPGAIEKLNSKTLLFSFPSQADLFQGKTEGGTAVQELIKWEQWSDLAEAVQEQVEVKKLLRNKLQRLRERQKGLQEPTAFLELHGVHSRRKTVQADETNPSLLQEMVAVRLEEQRASRRHKVTSWLRRLLLFLALLQFAVLILVLLKRDILNWVLPPKLAAAFGSRPARSRFF
ncbi:uncharacterized protein LOC143171342 [Aptenodytes patagonicus]|uniref:uncharacterized protein LOC143171342 n=1 Tax=Aptenodytes patagonicus TaxID=9234 RepID=UPI003FA04A38